MSQIARNFEPAVAVRITLVVLCAIWIALAVWVWRHRERLLIAPPDGTAAAAGPVVVAAGTLPLRTPPSDTASAAASGVTADVTADVATDVATGVTTDVAAGTASDRSSVVPPAAPPVDGALTGTPAGESAADLATDPVAALAEELAAAVLEARAGAASDGGPAASSAATEAAPDPIVPAPPARVPLASPTAARDVASAAPEPDGTVSESPFETRRREALAALPALVAELRFAPAETAPGTTLREPLERLFETLFLYPDTVVAFLVEGNEPGGAALNRRLSRERGETLVDHLVSRGLARERFEVRVGDGRGLPSGEHRVRVRVEDDPR